MRQTPSNLPATVSASPSALAKACAGALGVAGAVTVLFIMPAEAGVDPTGFGSLLGLTRMSQPEGEDAETIAGASLASRGTPTKDVIALSKALESQEMTIDLPPHTGKEIKARMIKGDGFVFEWASEGGPVKVDMHGERPDAEEGEFTSYWEERQLETGAGKFVAPFDGTHGWYWRNKGDTPVSVKLKISGFYQELFEPK